MEGWQDGERSPLDREPVGPEKRVLWGVKNFPVGLRNRFVGEVKARGLKVGEALEYLCSRWLRELRRQEERQAARSGEGGSDA